MCLITHKSELSLKYVDNHDTFIYKIVADCSTNDYQLFEPIFMHANHTIKYALYERIWAEDLHGLICDDLSVIVRYDEHDKINHWSFHGNTGIHGFLNLHSTLRYKIELPFMFLHPETRKLKILKCSVPKGQIIIVNGRTDECMVLQCTPIEIVHLEN